MLLAHTVRISPSKFRSCVLALTVIASLVIPMFLVGASESVKAKNFRPVETRPNNAPPEPFLMPSEKRGWESLGDRLSGLSSQVASLFAASSAQSAANSQTPDGQSQELVQLDRSPKTDDVETSVDEANLSRNDPTEKSSGESPNSETGEKSEETAPVTMFTTGGDG